MVPDLNGKQISLSSMGALACTQAKVRLLKPPGCSGQKTIAPSVIVIHHNRCNLMCGKRFAMTKKRNIYALQLSYIGWGVFWGAWGVLLPQFKYDLGLSDVAIGTTLMGISIGAIPAMIYGTKLIEKRPEFALKILLKSSEPPCWVA